MSIVLNRARETISSGGTGNLTLSGAATGHQTFYAATGSLLTVYVDYWIEDGSAWETGIGHLSASTTFVRDLMHASSTGSALNVSTSAEIFSEAHGGGLIHEPAGIADAATATFGVHSAHIVDLTTNASMTGGRLYVLPFLMMQGRDIDAVIIRPTSINSSKYRVCEYVLQPDGFPGAKLWETADITPATAITTATITQRYWAPGWHYLGFQCDVTDTFNGAQTNAGQSANPIGVMDSAVNDDFSTNFEYSSTTWPMPDPAGTPTWKRSGGKINIRVRCV